MLKENDDQDLLHALITSSNSPSILAKIILCSNFEVIFTCYDSKAIFPSVFCTDFLEEGLDFLEDHCYSNRLPDWR
jgi:hypothetical protein